MGWESVVKVPITKAWGYYKAIFLESICIGLLHNLLYNNLAKKKKKNLLYYAKLFICCFNSQGSDCIHCGKPNKIRERLVIVGNIGRLKYCNVSSFIQFLYTCQYLNGPLYIDQAAHIKSKDISSTLPYPQPIFKSDTTNQLTHPITGAHIKSWCPSIKTAKSKSNMNFKARHV